jgi:hypothetical protein
MATNLCEYNRLVKLDNADLLPQKDIKKLNRLSLSLFGYVRHEPELFICDHHGSQCIEETYCEQRKEAEQEAKAMGCKFRILLPKTYKGAE